jgi:SAM-dependent methyltransferase
MLMSHAQDHFSAGAEAYARGRFGYPETLFEWLAGHCAERKFAWDCATGNRQAAFSLANRFDRVEATDISESLLAKAPVLKNVRFRQAADEDSGLENASVDLVTVAQALHWFELDRFWQEVRRVCKPGAVLAYWGYCWPQVNADVDARLIHLRKELESFWPERNLILQNGYREVHSPFAALDAPPFEVRVQWSRRAYMAHIATWSAIRYQREQCGADSLGDFEKNLGEIWLDETTLIVKWPLVFRAYRVGWLRVVTPS